MNITKILKNFISFRKKTILSILFILIVACISVTWFRGDFIINAGDQILPLSPVKDFKISILYTWDHFRATGFAIPSGLANFSYFGIMALFEVLGFSLVNSEKILYYLIFALSGLSIYFLAGILFSKKKEILKITAAFFYMFNFYPIFTIWIGLPPLGIFYALFPFLLALFIKSIRDEKVEINNFAFIILLAFFTSMITNPIYIIVLFICFLSYLIFFLIENPKCIVKIILRCISFIGIYICLNCWWIISLIANFNLFTSVGRIYKSKEIFEGLSLEANFLNLLRLLGYPIFNTSYIGDPSFPWTSIYNNSLFIIIGFIPIILIFLTLLIKQKNKIGRAHV